MARQSKPLTHTQIVSAKPKNKLYRLYDGNGLCLKITTTGAKVWEYRFKNPESHKDDTFVIGDFPAITLAIAREKHLNLRRIVMSGDNPKRELSDTSFMKIFNEWHAKWSEGKKEKSSREKKRLIEMYVEDYIGHLPINDIKPVMIVKILEGIENSGHLSLISQVKSIFSRTFRFSVSKGVSEFDPTHVISRDAYSKHIPKNHQALPLQEIYKLYDYFHNATAQIQIRRATELIVRNMARAQEVVKMKWEYIDFENKIINLPSSIIKTRREHAVPLSKQALTILELQKNDTEWVFPSISESGHIHVTSINRSLKRHGLNSTTHGNRSLASTLLHEVRDPVSKRRLFDSDVVEKSLAHKDTNVVRGTYNKAQYIEQRRELLQWWSDFIDKCDTKENNEKSLKDAGISLI